MSDQPQTPAPKPEKRTDYVTTEVRAMNQILTALKRLPNHRRSAVMAYINNLFEQSGLATKE